MVKSLIHQCLREEEGLQRRLRTVFSWVLWGSIALFSIKSYNLGSAEPLSFEEVVNHSEAGVSYLPLFRTITITGRAGRETITCLPLESIKRMIAAEHDSGRYKRLLACRGLKWVESISTMSWLAGETVKEIQPIQGLRHRKLWTISSSVLENGIRL